LATTRSEPYDGGGPVGFPIWDFEIYRTDPAPPTYPDAHHIEHDLPRLCGRGGNSYTGAWSSVDLSCARDAGPRAASTGHSVRP